MGCRTGLRCSSRRPALHGDVADVAEAEARAWEVEPRAVAALRRGAAPVTFATYATG